MYLQFLPPELHQSVSLFSVGRACWQGSSAELQDEAKGSQQPSPNATRFIVVDNVAGTLGIGRHCKGAVRSTWFTRNHGMALRLPLQSAHTQGHLCFITEHIFFWHSLNMIKLLHRPSEMQRARTDS